MSSALFIDIKKQTDKVIRDFKIIRERKNDGYSPAVMNGVKLPPPPLIINPSYLGFTK